MEENLRKLQGLDMVTTKFSLRSTEGGALFIVRMVVQCESLLSEGFLPQKVPTVQYQTHTPGA